MIAVVQRVPEEASGREGFCVLQESGVNVDAVDFALRDDLGDGV